MKRRHLIFLWIFLLGIRVSAQEESVVIDWMKRLKITTQDVNLKIVGDGEDWYEYYSEKGNVNIKAGTVSAMCHAVGAYLKEIGGYHYSWEGKNIVIPGQWPQQGRVAEHSPFKYRMYLNVCAFGYSTPWWDWERWEQEIDWMAFRGINMPTAMMGQEYVWKQVWKEFGLTDQELNDYFTGPAFLPWHRMGNLNEHGGPLPDSFIKREKKLQRKILNRMRELGMQPVVPAFSGYVPKALVEKFPAAVIREMGQWTPGIESRTYLLDPKDPLFKEIGKRFIKKYQETYGECRFFLADSFNEMRPPVSKENKLEELKAYGKVLYETIDEAAPGATWVMQGWLFGHDKKFWSPDAVQAFLSQVPEDKLLIQDFGNDRYDVWKSLDAFYGKQWIYGYVHNYGGTNPVFGDLAFYKRSVDDLLKDPHHNNLKGFGVMPEGIHNNSVVYEYLYDLAWQGTKKDLQGWMEKYLKNRYGFVSEALMGAWKNLSESTYAVKYWWPRWEQGAGSYLHNKRPSLVMVKAKEFPGDQEKLREVVKLYSHLVEKNPSNSLLAYDLGEFSRHYFAIKQITS